MRCVCMRPQPRMKPGISTLLKPHVLILQRNALRGSLTWRKGGAYHFDVAASSTPAASLSSVTAQRLTSLHKPRLGHRKEFYRQKEAISRRPSTMFPDHDNASIAAAPARAPDRDTQKPQPREQVAAY